MGYLLRYLPKDYKINKVSKDTQLRFIDIKVYLYLTTIVSVQVASYTGWILCTIMFCCAFFGPARMGSIDYIYNPVHAAMYNAFAPIGWCAIFAWATVLYHTGNTNGKHHLT